MEDRKESGSVRRRRRAVSRPPVGAADMQRADRRNGHVPGRASCVPLRIRRARARLRLLLCHRHPLAVAGRGQERRLAAARQGHPWRARHDLWQEGYPCAARWARFD